MRKLLSLVLAFAMILGLFAFPVSADESMYQAVGQELMNYGVLKGVDAQGTLKEMDKLTREESLVVLSRLVGEEDKAMATEAVADFTDVPATHWAAKYVAYAKLQGWTTGVSEKEFGLGQQVTTKQVVTFMMRALGYKEVKWEEAMTKAKELGLLEGVSAMAEDQIIRGEVFIVMKNTLYTKPMNEKQELIYKLGLKENPVPETLEVVDVKADNLKEVVVEFNQEVDKDSLKDAFRFVGASQGTLTSELKEDGKTVVVTVGSKLKNLKMYKFQVSGVKTLAGVKMEKVVKEFKVADVEAPVVEGIKVTGPQTFEVQFSEPLQSTNGKMTLFVNGKRSFGLNPEPRTDGEKVVKVKTSSLKDGVTYTVRVEDFKDFADYTNKIVEVDFDYAKVATAPTLEVVKATQEYVEVKFDRPVKGLKRDNFYHTFSSYRPIKAFEDMKKMNEGKDLSDEELKKSRDSVIVSFVPDVDKFVANDLSTKEWKPLPAGDVKFVVTGKNIVDAWGNKFEEFEQVLNITADKEAPVVESVEVTGENEIVVTFSKKVGVKKENYEILKEDGSKFDGLKFGVDAEGNTGVKLTVSSPKLVGKTVVLNIKDVKDTTINQNKLVAVESQTLTFGDKTFEGPKEAILYGDTDNKVAKVRIKFDEALNADTATNKKNYKFQVGTEAKTPDFEVSMFSDKIVELVFTEEEWKKKVGGTDVASLPGGEFKVILSNQITDVAGNQFSTFSKTLKVQKSTTADATKIKMEKVVSTTTDRIVVTFSEEVKKVEGGNQVAFEATDFELVESGTGNTYSVGNVLSEEVNEDGKTVLELELDKKKLSPSIDEMKLQINATVKNTLDVEMILGNKTEKITDKIKPEHVKYSDKFDYAKYEKYGFPKAHKDALDGKVAVAATYHSATAKYAIALVFNEAIKQDTMSTTSFKVKGFSTFAPKVQTDKNVVVIELDADEFKPEMFEDVTIEQSGIITDEHGNELESIKEIVIPAEAKNGFSVAGPKRFELDALITEVNEFLSKAVAKDNEDSFEQGKVNYVKTAEAHTNLTTQLAEANKVNVDGKTEAEYDTAITDLKNKFTAFKLVTKNVAPMLAGTPELEIGTAAGKTKVKTAAEARHYKKLDAEKKYFTLDEVVSDVTAVDTELAVSPADTVVFLKLEGTNVKAYTKVSVEAGQVAKAFKTPQKMDVVVSDSSNLGVTSAPVNFKNGTELSPTPVGLTNFSGATAQTFKVDAKADASDGEVTFKYEVLQGSEAMAVVKAQSLPADGVLTVTNGDNKKAKVKITMEKQGYLTEAFVFEITVAN